MNSQSFGGNWTQDKLKRLKKYLEAYMTVMKNQSFKTIYVDAFAGTGYIIPPRELRSEEHHLEIFPDAEFAQFLNGSARVALDIAKPFGEYLFIERSLAKCKELEKLKIQYPDFASRIRIENAEANEFLKNWCLQTNWSATRAVVFLDPFGMQVEWSLLEAIAATKSIDLWLLVPLGMGVNRLMPQNDMPPEDWSARLTAFFGTDDWKEKFYRPKSSGLFETLDLFDTQATHEKNTNHDELKNYFVARLSEIFEGVAPNPNTQYNSKNVPIFMLCFAAGNKKGTSIAIRIAENILRG